MTNIKEEKAFNNYVKAISHIYNETEPIEDSYYKPLIDFVNEVNKTYTIERTKKSGKDQPDFKARSNKRFVGYIECKEPNKKIDNLKEKDKEQIERYKSIEDSNLILTNFHEFILFQKGNQVGTKIKLFDINQIKSGIIPKIEGYSFQDFLEILDSFFYCPKIDIKTPEKLAEKLAKKAKILERLAKKDLEEDKNKQEKSSVTEFFRGLKDLIGDEADIPLCAEAFTETLIYGLFLAKLKLGNKPLRNTNAVNQIPPQIKVIKKLFNNIYGYNLPSEMIGIVDSIIQILNHSDINKIISRFELSDQDPFIRFYEDFLRIYNPKRRKEMGVFYTPNSIVSFIVRSVNDLLKSDFKRHLGLADQSVTVLDPCIGTGTFLAHAIDVGVHELTKNNYSKSLIEKKISEHFLKRFYGFEILVSPYILCHLKLSMVLEKEHYGIKPDERIPVYLTNTLDVDDLKNKEVSAYL